MEPLEPFTKPKAWRLTRCLNCRVEAHYRFEYTLEKNNTGEATCRACFWTAWAAEQRRAQGAHANLVPIPASDAQQIAEAHGYDYLGPLTSPSLTDDPHHVRCRHCQRVSADRLGDIEFGCTCQVNPGRSAQQAAAGPRNLAKDCGLGVLTWWDHESNTTADWETATTRSTREVYWRCPDCGLQFTKRVRDMVNHRSCPSCEPGQRAVQKARDERYRATPVADVPFLLEAWTDGADPRSVTVEIGGPARDFRCPQGHATRISPYMYLHLDCPSCAEPDPVDELPIVTGEDTAPYRLNPEIVAQWHPTKNRNKQVATVSPGSRKSVWWREPSCGHEWQESPCKRDQGQRLRCPQCRTILDSLAYHFPELAAEWSPGNPLSAWQVRPTGQTQFIPLWICSRTPEHTWQASLPSRSAGSGCPECREHGKSRVELEYHKAAAKAFGRAASGQSVRHAAFTRRSHWLVDITAELPQGRNLAIEYDGSYWHANKAELDVEKSYDLLRAGYLVVRLREHPLPPLPIDDPGYTEFVVYATAPTPEATTELVKQWAVTRPICGSPGVAE
ncbi:zinc-ribbon domain-containing protein [Streptomyces sp. NPDC058145]|uniref:zinc-ribbon domain-containing protein n=1 Tax=Streptomyces sp. NPDC058145 TaxID=3346356 RepID=UPI0036EFE24D